jgi:hypothetical protein
LTSSVSYGCFHVPDHYICHAFLFIADSGIGSDSFPRDRKITAVCRVSRIEEM